MSNQIVKENIETSFRRLVNKDKRIRNAYLLVNSAKADLDIMIAEGNTGGIKANINQANHLASVGKIFTATVIGMLGEKGLVSYNDSISKYLDADLMKGLHIYKNKDYSDKITVRNLLMQTSGLNDVFYHLWKKIINDPELQITPRQAVVWGKENLKPVAVPGKRLFYTDTNYYLLGLIIENILKKQFHEVIHELIFTPLKMEYSSINGYSKPLKDSGYPVAGIYIKNNELLSFKNMYLIDYAGGGVIAPLSDYLLFIKALVSNKLITSKTLDLMISDDIDMGFPTIGFRYGYSVWKPKSIPLLIPKKLYCWGCFGVTGAFMFYHPLTETYVIGSFNDFAYRGKALDFMFNKVLKPILEIV